MNDAAAFQATVHGFRTVPTRKVVQVTIEAPIEQHARIAEIAEHGAWVAVARINLESEVVPPEHSNSTNETRPPSSREAAGAAKREFTLPQRVAMVCGEPRFATFLSETWPTLFNEYAKSHGLDEEKISAEFVRSQCLVESRAEILPGTEAARKWDELSAKYEMWKRT